MLFPRKRESNDHWHSVKRILPTEWSAEYYDGRTAQSHPARIKPTGRGLEFYADGDLHFWRYEDIDQTQGNHAFEHVRFQTRADLPEAIVVKDTDLLRKIRDLGSPDSPRFHDPDSRARRRGLMVAAIVGIGLAGWLIYMYAIPVSVRLATAIIPVSWEEALGRSAVAHIAPSEKRSDLGIHTQVMDRLVARLTSRSDFPYEFKVYVVEDSRFNAFALPGGYIAFNTGLIRMMDTPEQLAGILAHEIQHVVQRHGTRFVLRQISTRALIAAIGGQEGGVDYVLDWASLAGALRFSRENETSADHEGMKLILEAGIDPVGMVEALKTILDVRGDLPRGLSYLSSHPLTRDRIQLLEPYLDSLRGDPKPIISDAEWQDFLEASDQ